MLVALFLICEIVLSLRDSRREQSASVELSYLREHREPLASDENEVAGGDREITPIHRRRMLADASHSAAANDGGNDLPRVLHADLEGNIHPGPCNPHRQAGCTANCLTEAEWSSTRESTDIRPRPKEPGVCRSMPQYQSAKLDQLVSFWALSSILAKP